MNLDRDELRTRLMEKMGKKLDEVLASPTVTMTDIENVAGKLQREIGREAAEGLLALKKTAKKD